MLFRPASNLLVPFMQPQFRRGRAASGGGGGNGLLTSLVAHWNLEEASGTRVDEHGANDLSPGNAPGSATGKLGDGVDLERSSSQYLSRADTSDLSTGAGVSFSFSFWFKPETVAIVQFLISKYGGGGNEYAIWMDSGTSKLFFQIRGNNGVLSSVAMSAGTWYFVVGSYRHTDGQISVSVNGGAADTGTEGTNPSDGTSDFKIGYDGSGNYVDGVVDHVSFWKGRVLSSDDITALYNGGSGLAYASYTS